MSLLFSTPLFLFAFFPVVLLLYFFAPVRLRNIILFGSSFCFFCWGEPVFTWLVLASAIFDWCLCHVMSIFFFFICRFSLAFVCVLGNISICRLGYRLSCLRKLHILLMCIKGYTNLVIH